jgi:hypothetical protein
MRCTAAGPTAGVTQIIACASKLTACHSAQTTVALGAERGTNERKMVDKRAYWEKIADQRSNEWKMADQGERRAGNGSQGTRRNRSVAIPLSYHKERGGELDTHWHTCKYTLKGTRPCKRARTGRPRKEHTKTHINLHAHTHTHIRPIPTYNLSISALTACTRALTSSIAEEFIPHNLNRITSSPAARVRPSDRLARVAAAEYLHTASTQLLLL